jgi:hypothetical protein
MKPRPLNTLLILSSLAFAACRTETRMDADGFYKVHRFGKGPKPPLVADAPKRKAHSRNAATGKPDDYDVYDIGKTVDRRGNVIPAHQSVRYVPGVRGVTMPDNYQPPPASERIDAAVADAEQAKARMDSATQDIQAKLAEVNGARQEIERLTQENQELKAQAERIFGENASRTMPAVGVPVTDAAKAGAAAADPDTALAAFKKRQEGK